MRRKFIFNFARYVPLLYIIFWTEMIKWKVLLQKKQLSWVSDLWYVFERQNLEAKSKMSSYKQFKFWCTLTQSTKWLRASLNQKKTVNCVTLEMAQHKENLTSMHPLESILHDSFSWQNHHKNISLRMSVKFSPKTAKKAPACKTFTNAHLIRNEVYADNWENCRII